MLAAFVMPTDAAMHCGSWWEQRGDLKIRRTNDDRSEVETP